METIDKFEKLCKRIREERPEDTIAVRLEGIGNKQRYLVAYPWSYGRQHEEVIVNKGEIYEYLGKITQNYTVIQHILHDGSYGVPDVDRLDYDRIIDY